MNKEIYSNYIDNINNMDKEELIEYILNMYKAMQVHNELEDKQQRIIKNIKKYLKNKSYHNLGYWVEDEEGGDVFIDVKEDILDIIKER